MPRKKNPPRLGCCHWDLRFFSRYAFLRKVWMHSSARFKMNMYLCTLVAQQSSTFEGNSIFFRICLDTEIEERDIEHSFSKLLSVEHAAISISISKIIFFSHRFVSVMTCSLFRASMCSLSMSPGVNFIAVASLSYWINTSAPTEHSDAKVEKWKKTWNMTVLTRTRVPPPPNSGPKKALTYKVVPCFVHIIMHYVCLPPKCSTFVSFISTPIPRTHHFAP